MRIAPWIVTVSMTFAAPVSAATVNPVFDSLTPRAVSGLAFSSLIEEDASTGGSLAGRAGGLPHAVADRFVADLFDGAHPLAGDILPANIIATLVSSDCSAHKRSTPGPGKGGACSDQSGAVAKQSVGAAKESVGAAKQSVGAGLSVASILDLPNGKTVDRSDRPSLGTQTVAVIPVPATLTLLLTGCGLLYLAAQRRRRAMS